MKDKGFTIVELAIVLVVIGIILGMAVKGKALVEAAQIKADVAALNKFEAAFAIQYATSGSFPVADTGQGILNQHIYPDHFIEKGYFTQKDIESRYAENLTWTFIYCVVNPLPGDPGYAGASIMWENGIQAISNYNVCAYPTKETAIGGGGNPFPAFTKADGYLACNIEVIKDDSSLDNGTNRKWATMGETNFTEAEFKNCDLTKRQERAFGYMVF
jgi:prepilin-type N-terminal cleavage/methylation domain-containing protein